MHIALPALVIMTMSIPHSSHGLFGHMDAYAVPQLAAEDFWAQPNLPVPSFPQRPNDQILDGTPIQTVQPGPRNYKSRKYRPCDFCRTRQVACKIDSAPPCQLCRSHSRECTFVERPKKKRRPNIQGPSEMLGSDSGTIVDGRFTSVETVDAPLAPSAINNMNPDFMAHLHSPQFTTSGSHLVIEPQNILPSNLTNISPNYEFQSIQATSKTPEGRPLDTQTSQTPRYVGETGEINPYILHQYQFDGDDECTISSVTYRRLLQTAKHSRSEPPLMFQMIESTSTYTYEPRFEEESYRQAHHTTLSMISENQGLRLFSLYFQFVHPSFPILSPAQYQTPNNSICLAAFRSVPLALRAAIYAATLPYSLYDDALSPTIFAATHTQPLLRAALLAALQDSHAPSLATLQALLLILFGPSQYDASAPVSPLHPSLASWAVSLTHTLGLHRDPTHLPLPVEEISLRKCLFHAVLILDTWLALSSGTPSHIHDSDNDVPPLLASDLSLSSHAHPSSSCFLRLSTLTAIVRDIVSTFYTLSAARLTSSNLTIALELARPLRPRLRAWVEDGQHESSYQAFGTPVQTNQTSYHGNEQLYRTNDPSYPLKEATHQSSSAYASNEPIPQTSRGLRIAHLTASNTLYGALLRPLEIALDIGLPLDDEAVRDVRRGALDVVRETVDFAEMCSDGAVGEWYSFSASQFASASSFLTRLQLTAASEAEAAELLALESRWRWALSVGGGCMSRGVVRMDGVGGDGGAK